MKQGWGWGWGQGLEGVRSCTYRWVRTGGGGSGPSTQVGAAGEEGAGRKDPLCARSAEGLLLSRTPFKVDTLCHPCVAVEE